MDPGMNGGYGPNGSPGMNGGYGPNGSPRMNGGYAPNGSPPMNGGPGMYSPQMNDSGIHGQWLADVVIAVDFGMTCTGEYTSTVYE